MPALNRKKLLLLVPVMLLVAGGAAYELVLAPTPKAPPKKIDGAVVPLQKEFLLNLEGGRYAKVSVALVLPHAPEVAGPETGLLQEPAVRAVVTDMLTGLAADSLVVRARRRELLERIRKAIRRSTDEDVERVLFTDITVQ